MSLRKVPFLEGEYYHIYNRGNSRKKIFLDDKDYSHFVKLLYLCNSVQGVNFRDRVIEKKIDAWSFKKGDPIVSIGAWVLMPNHFHLLVKVKENIGYKFSNTDRSTDAVRFDEHKWETIDLSACAAPDSV